MSLLDVNISEDINVLKATNSVFVIVDQENRPMVLISVSTAYSLKELSQLTASLYGQQRVDMAFFNIPFEAQEVKERIDQLMLNDPPTADNLESEDNDLGKLKKFKSVFSNRELEILQLIALEYTNEEIADKLCLAKRTVDNHRVNLMQRVNVKNTAGLISYAFRNGLVA